MEKRTEDLGNGVYIIDLHDLDQWGRTGAYVLTGGDITIIETSASPSIPYLKQGLKELGIELEDVKHIIVTHIHLDHAGGTGLFLQSCPNARVYVHPRGNRHLANPERLMKGARAVYGDDFDRLFDPIIPIDEQRLISKNDGEILDIGNSRTLTFYDTPGHAKHHFSIHDSRSNGIFTGDTIGVCYPQLLEKGLEIYLPSTSPSQFNEEDMMRSAERLEALKPERIYFGHYSMTEKPQNVFQQISYWLPQFMDLGRRVMTESPEADFQEKTTLLSEKMMKLVMDEITRYGVSIQPEALHLLKLDMNVSAMGIIERLSLAE
ncbi:MBL fold metallo-hydrolase [Cytobacillus gottheilii]|uniref:MBL fold metallo-hydrolase n=1 Tax=Cytobacillus gottheilii TaxID=859144 RepID=UPI0009BB9DBE|nr:MBL fold metallo-hydrolase [Cytobacillus gottheilii]